MYIVSDRSGNSYRSESFRSTATSELSGMSSPKSSLNNHDSGAHLLVSHDNGMDIANVISNLNQSESKIEGNQLHSNAVDYTSSSMAHKNTEINSSANIEGKDYHAIKKLFL